MIVNVVDIGGILRGRSAAIPLKKKKTTFWMEPPTLCHTIWNRRLSTKPSSRITQPAAIEVK